MSKIKRFIQHTKKLGSRSNTFGGADLNTFMNEVTKEFDKLNNKIGGTDTPSKTTGAEGSLRITFEGDTPYVEFKSNKGWIRSDSSSASGFSIKK